MPLSRWRVEVTPVNHADDAHGHAALADIRHMGLEHITDVVLTRVYLLEGILNRQDVQLLAEHLFADPVTESFEISHGFAAQASSMPTVEIHPLPGVMNPAAISARDAAERQLHNSEAEVEGVQTAKRFQIDGAAGPEEVEVITASVLANDCIEAWFIQCGDRRDAVPDRFPHPPIHPFELRTVKIRELDDARLESLARDAHLFLSLAEMHQIRDHFATLERDPTDLELETLAQTWSEHCVHKTLKSAVTYEGPELRLPDGNSPSGKTVKVEFTNLLAETIAAATRKLDKPWCLSVFEDNAGIIAFDDEDGIAFKVETHNHPSAIEPYGGAATGIGGCIRDIMGCGLGAKPIASTDVFCVAHQDFDRRKLPGGVLHPARVLKGIVSGVRDYGNRMGIPTVNGAVYFDDRYLANPLVYCGSVGIIPRNRISKKPNEADLIVVAGGRTGRDGIHGATFSSAELTDDAADEFSHAVQIGNAIEEKKVLDALLRARDAEGGCLFSAVTDCGAGGLSSAVGEMAAELGAEVDLEKVPLKYSGLRYDEIWISEAQERMVFAVPESNLKEMLQTFRDEEVEATVIGRFTGDATLHVRYDNKTVGRLDMKFLHEGLPRRTLKAAWKTPDVEDPPHDRLRSGKDLLNALANPNIASKEWIIRQYDHEVQGRSVVKPLVGRRHGPSDAAVIRPKYGSAAGAAVACGMCPNIGDRDPYVMAVQAVDEALRNVICVGANPERVAILDNFCWPRTDNPQSLGALVRACQGAHDAAVAFELPFISGKDSLNNEFAMDPAEARRIGMPERIAIPPTLLISAIGIVKNVDRCVTMDFKHPGSAICLASRPVSRVGLKDAARWHRSVAELIQSGKARAAHDVSDGGIACTIAEMCIASGLGAQVNVDPSAMGAELLQEIPTSYVLEMSTDDARQAGLMIIGTVVEEAALNISRNDELIARIAVDDLEEAWKNPGRSHGTDSSRLR